MKLKKKYLALNMTGSIANNIYVVTTYERKYTSTHFGVLKKKIGRLRVW